MGIHVFRVPPFPWAGGRHAKQHEGHDDPGQGIGGEPWQGGGQTCGVEWHGSSALDDALVTAPGGAA
jgi:hypothetical protein